MRSHDHLTLYDQERYLFDTVSTRYQQGDDISAFDFFCIVIWKANRAKSKIARRLLEKDSDLNVAVARLVAELRSAPTHEDRLRVMTDWGFHLPMASAVLTVFYPDVFTVYDIRVCEQLGDFANLDNLKFERRWAGYCRYIAAVREAVSEDLSLRDKDRVLWARSFRQQLVDDVASGFIRTP